MYFNYPLAPQLVEVLCCWDLWWKLFPLSLNEGNPHCCWFVWLWAAALALVAASLLFWVLSQTPMGSVGQIVGQAGEQGVLVTGKHWGGVSCWKYHVSLCQWWKAPGESKLFLPQWSLVFECAWLGLPAAIGHGFVKQKENAALLPQIFHQ